MPHLTSDELIDYTNGERKKWHQWLAANPDAMSVPAQRQGRFLSGGSLIDHIFLVERRHLQRLMGQSPIADRTGVVWVPNLQPRLAKCLSRGENLGACDTQRASQSRQLHEQPQWQRTPVAIARESF